MSLLIEYSSISFNGDPPKSEQLYRDKNKKNLFTIFLIKMFHQTRVGERSSLIISNNNNNNNGDAWDFNRTSGRRGKQFSGCRGI